MQQRRAAFRNRETAFGNDCTVSPMNNKNLFIVRCRGRSACPTKPKFLILRCSCFLCSTCSSVSICPPTNLFFCIASANIKSERNVRPDGVWPGGGVVIQFFTAARQFTTVGCDWISLLLGHLRSRSAHFSVCLSMESQSFGAVGRLEYLQEERMPHKYPPSN